jgi:hypothetical protein
LCSPFTATSRRGPQCRGRHVGQRRHCLGPRGPGQDGGAHPLGQFSPGQQLGIDRRDLREQLLDLLAVAQVPAHHLGQGRRDVPQPAPGRGLRDKEGIRAVRLPDGASAAGLAAPPRLLGQRPGQHLLGASEPRGQGAPPRQQPPRGHARQAGLVRILLLSHHKRLCRCQA